MLQTFLQRFQLSLVNVVYETLVFHRWSEYILGMFLKDSLEESTTFEMTGQIAIILFCNINFDLKSPVCIFKRLINLQTPNSCIFDKYLHLIYIIDAEHKDKPNGSQVHSLSIKDVFNMLNYREHSSYP